MPNGSAATREDFDRAQLQLRCADPVRIICTHHPNLTSVLFYVGGQLHLYCHRCGNEVLAIKVALADFGPSSPREDEGGAESSREDRPSVLRRRWRAAAGAIAAVPPIAFSVLLYLLIRGALGVDREGFEILYRALHPGEVPPRV